MKNIEYTTQEKSRAHKRLKADQQVDYFNKEISKIEDMWSHPQKIGLTSIVTGKTTVISETTPQMPDEVKEIINRLTSERDKYVSQTYPELSRE